MAIGGAGVGGTLATTGGTSVTSGGTTSGGTAGATGGTGLTGGTAGAGGASGGSSGSAGTGGSGGSGKTACKAPQPSQNTGNACKNAPPPALKLSPVVTGLALPVFVTQAPGDKTKLYVVEQRGVIRVVKGGQIEGTPFLDITSKVASAIESGVAGEQGLLGLAFDPNYQQTGRFWLKYSKAGTARGDNVVAQYEATPGGNADPASEKVLADISQPHPNILRSHNGGMLAFGPDGCLYIGYGDGGGFGDPPGNGQATNDVFGAILRIDVENFPAAAPGNMTGANVNPHLWDYGLRNPWRFSFDATTGDLYIGDVGQDAWEEIDVEPAGTGHLNYGWNVMEAAHCFNGAVCDQGGKTLPAVEYANPAAGQASVVGGYVYRGAAIPGMVGRYVYGDAFTRKLSTFIYSGRQNGVPQVCDKHDLSIAPTGNLYSFGQDLDGEIYLVTAEGGLYRIDPG